MVVCSVSRPTVVNLRAFQAVLVTFHCRLWVAAICNILQILIIWSKSRKLCKAEYIYFANSCLWLRKSILFVCEQGHNVTHSASVHRELWYSTAKRKYILSPCPLASSRSEGSKCSRARSPCMIVVWETEMESASLQYIYIYILTCECYCHVTI
jgi:hypothetical protein